MLVYDKAPRVATRLRREREGTKLSLWLHQGNGSLNAQITSHIQGKSVTLVRLDGFYLIAEAIIELGFIEDIMPYAYVTGKGEIADAYMKPLKTNVTAIIDRSRWPLVVADRMAAAAQYMVGHFTGRMVKVGQMGDLKLTDQGEIDTSVEMGDPWVEQFELADECVFCRKMTDESVLDRVAGFQWALDKEVAGRFGAGLVPANDAVSNPVVDEALVAPSHYDYEPTDEGRRAYHEVLKPWYAHHPMLLKVVPLIDLPLHLKRTLCIQWNHIVVDHLEVEPRFIYREEDGMYFWMDVNRDDDDTTRRIIPKIETRSGVDILAFADLFAGENYYGHP